MITDDIRNIINDSRANAVRSVDFCRVQMYWRIGQRIVEEEQGGNIRAEYGIKLIRNLATQLEPEFGSGFSYRQLNFSRQFYLEYPKVNALVHNSTGRSIVLLFRYLTRTNANTTNWNQLPTTGPLAN